MKRAFGWLLLVSLLCCAACSDNTYRTQEFSFPPRGANPKYNGTIAYSSRGDPKKVNLKTLKIVVKDPQGKVVLDDNMQFNGADIDVGTDGGNLYGALLRYPHGDVTGRRA